MNEQNAPGPCPKCGSPDTKVITAKPPKVKKRGDKESKTAHVCTPKCEQSARFCISCHLVTPLPVGMAAPAIPAQRLGDLAPSALKK